MSQAISNHAKKSTNLFLYVANKEIVRFSNGILRTGTRGFMTNASPLYSKYYNSLNLTPNATQNEIKSAYYKLSMLYHPDKNKDAEAAQKFRDINEAYEILGNVNLKKMYDRGVLGNEDLRSDMKMRAGPKRPGSVHVDPKMKFYESHANREKIPTMDGSVPIYDFDAWNRAHYDDQRMGKGSRYRPHNENPFSRPNSFSGPRRPFTNNRYTLPLIYQLIAFTGLVSLGLAFIMIMDAIDSFSDSPFDKVIVKKKD